MTDEASVGKCALRSCSDLVVVRTETNDGQVLFLCERHGLEWWDATAPRAGEPESPQATEPWGGLNRLLAERPEHVGRRPDGSMYLRKCDDPRCLRGGCRRMIADPTLDPTRYVCDLCWDEFATIEALQAHIETETRALSLNASGPGPEGPEPASGTRYGPNDTGGV